MTGLIYGAQPNRTPADNKHATRTFVVTITVAIPVVLRALLPCSRCRQCSQSPCPYLAGPVMQALAAWDCLQRVAGQLELLGQPAALWFPLAWPRPAARTEAGLLPASAEHSQPLGHDGQNEDLAFAVSTLSLHFAAWEHLLSCSLPTWRQARCHKPIGKRQNRQTCSAMNPKYVVLMQ